MVKKVKRETDMLVAARDEDGMASVFDVDEFHEVIINCGTWVSRVNRDRCGVAISEKLCTGIPPGEKRVIDLEKSTIVHVQPAKSAVEELVGVVHRILGYVPPLARNSEVMVQSGDLIDLQVLAWRIKQEKEVSDGK